MFMLTKLALAADQYQLVFSIDDPVQQCDSAQISYAVQPTFEASVVPITLVLGLQTGDGSNYIALTDNAQLFNNSWTWNPVTVDVGQYRLIGTDETGSYGIHGVSTLFDVQPGSSTSCLSSTSASNTTSATTSPQLPIQTPSSNSSSSSSSSSSTQLPTGIPISAASTSASHISSGAKAGLGIAAALIVLAALGAIYWFFVVRKRNARGGGMMSGASAGGGSTYGAAAARSANNKGGGGHWGGLASVDEHHNKEAVPGYGYSLPRDPSSRSFGSVDPQHSHSPFTTSSALSELAEKNSHYRSETPSAGALYGYNAYPPLSPAEVGEGAAYLPPVAFPEPLSAPLTTTNRQPQTLIRTSSSLHDETSPITPTTSSGGERRSKGPTTRKPVPSYTSDNNDSPSPTNDSENNRQSYLDPFASRQSSVSSSSEHLHAPSPAHELVRQASFGDGQNGGKQMHVLSVDVPPPERVVSPPIKMPGRR